MIKIIPKKRLLTLCLILCAVTVFLVCCENNKSVSAIKTKGIVTGDMRADFLREIGLTVEENRYDYKKITIPEEFDDVYDKYNEIQKIDGFDLKKYSGKTVDKFTYTVKKYPGYENEKVYVTLLIYKGRIIGGDISSARVDGFMKNLYNKMK